MVLSYRSMVYGYTILMIEFPADRQLEEIQKKQLLDELLGTVPEGTLRYNKGSLEVYGNKKWIPLASNSAGKLTG